MKKIFIISFLILIVDQIIKLSITSSITLYQTISIIKYFFYLTHVHNIGAAWSILEENGIFLILIALTSLVLIYIFLIKNKDLKQIDKWTYGILIGGILGNLFDRIIHGYVIDYLEFHIFNYHFPIFNLADICIVVSVMLIVISIIKEEGHGKNNR